MNGAKLDDGDRNGNGILGNRNSAPRVTAALLAHHPPVLRPSTPDESTANDVRDAGRGIINVSWFGWLGLGPVRSQNSQSQNSQIPNQRGSLES